ncbi:DinF_protein [Hexamita inflata]|uniref:DinF protein n=1 Tax=Hexamita inflata TaxID=28002 RepID=A0AA86R021_9EUKA|nr:DinF protein [Hexamita inflata]
MSEHNFLSSELEVAVNNSNSDVNEHLNDDNVKNKFDDKVLLRLQNMAVTPLLWHFVLPAILANSISAVTNAIQTTIQKNVMGNIGIAASAIVQPLELMLTMYTSVGLSGGAVSFISPALGRQDLKTAQKYLMHYMFIYLVFIVLVPLCTLPWLPTLVLLLGAPENSDLQKYAIQYGTISFSLATVFYFINYGFGNILRADSRSVFNGVKQIITACLELLFYYIFYYGIVAKGHVQLYTNALAPVLANALSASVVICMFIPFKKLFKRFQLKFSVSGWRPFSFRVVFEIIYFAIPDWLAQFQIPLMIMVANALLKRISNSYAQTEQWITNLGVVYKMSPLIAVTNQSFSYAFGPSFQVY